jgi:hypothetical protein
MPDRLEASMPDGSIARRPVITAAFLGLTGCYGRTDVVVSPEPRVWFIEPADGADVTSPVRVRFGVEGYTVTRSGDPTPGTGHHHLIIDRDPWNSTDESGRRTGIPFDDNHLHYGDGQVETMVVLSPGTHTLTAQFADGRHVPIVNNRGRDMTATIRVNVVPPPPIG